MAKESSCADIFSDALHVDDLSDSGARAEAGLSLNRHEVQENFQPWHNFWCGIKGAR